MRFIVTCVVVVVSVGLICAGEGIRTVEAPAPPEQLPVPAPSIVRPVEVVNFPNPQNVAGTVNVGNLPVIQQVAGQVEVINLPTPARFQLVGFSSASYDGYQGILTYTLACQADFPDSRMCTSAEIMQSTNIPPAPVVQDPGPPLPQDAPVSAWVIPVIAETTEIGSPENYVEDVSGFRVPWPKTLSCVGWSNTAAPPPFAPEGLSLFFDTFATRYGMLGTRPCHAVSLVACCRQVN